MITSTDLLDHARKLAVQDGTTADFSRAISACYYALFHALIETARARFVSATAAPETVRAFTSRFGHDEMKKTCEALRTAAATGDTRSQLLKKGLPPQWTTLLPAAEGQTPPPDADKKKYIRAPNADLREVCDAFCNLQPFRHKADYDLSWMPDLATAQAHVTEADEAIDAWNRCCTSSDAEVFLLACVDLLKFRDA
jgi:hypothetical protein